VVVGLATVVAEGSWVVLTDPKDIKILREQNLNTKSLGNYKIAVDVAADVPLVVVGALVAITVPMVASVPRSVGLCMVSVLSVAAIPNGVIDTCVVVAAVVLVVGVTFIKAVAEVDVLRVVLIVVVAAMSVVVFVVVEVGQDDGIGLPLVAIGVIVGFALRAVELVAGSVTSVTSKLAGLVDACEGGV